MAKKKVVAPVVVDTDTELVSVLKMIIHHPRGLDFLEELCGKVLTIRDFARAAYKVGLKVEFYMDSKESPR